MYILNLSVNIRNVNNVEHMEIVNTSAEGASLGRMMVYCPYGYCVILISKYYDWSTTMLPPNKSILSEKLDQISDPK